MPRNSAFCWFLIVSFLTSPLWGISQSHPTQLDSLELVLSRMPSSKKVDRVLLMERISRLYKQRDINASEKFAQETMALAMDSQNPHTISLAYRLLADITSLQGDYALGAEYAEKARAVLDNLTDSLSLAEKYEVMMMAGGWLTSKSTFPKKIEWGYRSIELFTLLGNNEGIAKATFNAGSLARNLAADRVAVDRPGANQDFNKAMTLFRQTEILYRKLNNKAEIAASIHAQAEIQIGLGNLSVAYELSKKSLAVFSREACYLGAGLSYSQIAEIFHSRKQFDSALVNIQKAIHLCEQVGFTAGLPYLYDVKTTVYEGLRDYQNALLSHQRARIEHDKRFAIEQTKRMNGVQKTYEIQLREEKIKTLSAEKSLQGATLERQRRTTIIISVAAVILLSMTFIIFYNRTRYQKRIRAIELENKLKEEKERISQDLHDNIGSQLTSVSLGLNKLIKKYPMDQPQVGHLIETLNLTMGELRDTIWAINKVEVTLQELIDKINTLIWRIRQSDSRIFNLTFPPDRREEKLKPSQAINTFRVIQESIHNSIKHSKSRETSISIEFGKDGALDVFISDNGVGFEPDSRSSRDHYGMANMKKRAQEIQGELTVTTSLGQGTTIHLRFLLANSNEAAQKSSWPESRIDKAHLTRNVARG